MKLLLIYRAGGARPIINEAVAESCWGRSADWPREWPPTRWTAIRHAKPFLRHQTVAALVAGAAAGADGVVDEAVVVVVAAVGGRDSSRIP